MKTIDGRNPYLILALSFGADEEDARSSFARLSKQARTGVGAHTLDDLTWALQQIEHELSEPWENVSLYRVPAIPEAYLPLQTIEAVPAPKPMPRQTPSGSGRAAIERAVAVELAQASLSQVSAHPPAPYSA